MPSPNPDERLNIYAIMKTSLSELLWREDFRNNVMQICVFSLGIQEVPLVVADQVQSFKKTKEAVVFLRKNKVSKNKL